MKEGDVVYYYHKGYIWKSSIERVFDWSVIVNGVGVFNRFVSKEFQPLLNYVKTNSIYN